MSLATEGERLDFDENHTPTIEGGFDFAFVDELSSGQKCSICLHAMRVPVQTARCGHRFCESCLLATFRCESFHSETGNKMLSFDLLSAA